MDYRNLGNSGLKISEISLGGWVTFGNSVQDPTMVRDIVTRAYDLGINFFDQADIYAKGKSEEMMGEVLREFPRHSLVISSKVFNPIYDGPNGRGLSRKHMLEAIEGSLKRLGTDYLDIYFAHRYDFETPLEETVMAFDHLVRTGKILYWGTSEWTPAQIAEAATFAKQNGLYPPVTEQPQYNMLYSSRVEDTVLPVTERHGLGLVVWSPLAMGALTGKYDDGLPAGTRFGDGFQFGQEYVSEETRAKVRNLKSIAEDLGITRTQLALAWVLRQKGVSSAIVGATKVTQLEESAGASGVKLSDEVLEKIKGVLEG